MAKWTPEQRAKFRKTWKLKKAQEAGAASKAHAKQPEPARKRRPAVMLTASSDVLFDILRAIPKDARVDIQFVEEGE